jgi:hypothetical protein
MRLRRTGWWTVGVADALADNGLCGGGEGGRRWTGMKPVGRKKTMRIGRAIWWAVPAVGDLDGGGDGVGGEMELVGWKRSLCWSW